MRTAILPPRHKIVAHDPNDLIQILSTLKPGQTVVYHQGYLDSDRRGNHNVGFIANEALRLCEAGKIHLFKRRVGRIPGGTRQPMTCYPRSRRGGRELAPFQYTLITGNGEGFKYIAMGARAKSL